jgi:hypothetical protein
VLLELFGRIGNGLVAVLQVGFKVKRYIYVDVDEGMRLTREPGAVSREGGKRERGTGIVIRNPEIDKFHQK